MTDSNIRYELIATFGAHEVRPGQLKGVGGLVQRLHSGERPSLHQLASRFDAMGSMGAMVALARVRGVAVGMAVLHHRMRADGKLVFTIEEVAVASHVEGKGIGRGLMERLIEQARSMLSLYTGATGHIELTSRADRVRARRLYASLGFMPRDTGVFRLTL